MQKTQYFVQCIRFKVQEVHVLYMGKGLESQFSYIWDPIYIY